jgi:hydroxyethylthiazole kinase-like uncharacterized protein yjeF
MMKPVTADVMSEIDRRAREEYGIAQVTLMENAGRAAAEVISGDSSSFPDEKIAIFCGKGNNGGDGFVIARCLANLKPASLAVYVTDPANIRPGAALDNFNIIKKMGIDIRPLDDFIAQGGRGGFTIGVDAVFGTGFRGQLPEACAAMGAKLNPLMVKIYAIDVPSGLDATTGEAAEGCVRARRTITFGLPKKGFYQNDGPAVCGDVVVRDIGFPKALLEPYL